MTGKDFINGLAKGECDVIEVLLGILGATGADYCVIGGLGVNAYAEPVVSLDLDLVVVAESLDRVRAAAEAQGMRTEGFPHSLNLTMPGSDLRIQLQTDPRYQDFVGRAVGRKVLGYEMRVAALEDILRGKVWAWSDASRRRSKRQKDLADVLRLVETYPELEAQLPPEMQRLL